MRIGKENIEEVIFDFHEGDLSDEGKAELMDFLHKHPEYEREFMLWAKTYHTDKPLLDYGNEDRFLKKKYSSPLKWGALTIAAGIMAVVIFWPKQNVEETLPVTEEVKQVVPKLSPIMQEKKASIVARPAKGNPVKETKEIQAVPVQADSSEPAPSMPSIPAAIAQPDTVVQQAAVLPKNEPIVEKKKPMKPDSSVVHKKPRRKRKLNLTPTDDILPFNSDF